MVFILLQIRQRDLENSSLQCVVCILQPGCPVDKSLANTCVVSNESGPDLRRAYSRTWKVEGAFNSIRDYPLNQQE